MGGEFDCEEVRELHRNMHIEHKFTPPYLEGWRGLVERGNGLLHEVALALLADSGLSFKLFWRYAYESAMVLVNVSVTTDGKIPYKMLHNKHFDFSTLKYPWGAKCMYHFKTKQKRIKSRPGILLLPANSIIGDTYRIYSIETKVVIISRDFNVISDDDIINNELYGDVRMAFQEVGGESLLSKYNINHPNFEYITDDKSKEYVQSVTGDWYYYEKLKDESNSFMVNDVYGNSYTSNCYINNSEGVNKKVSIIDCGNGYSLPKNVYQVKNCVDKAEWYNAIEKELISLMIDYECCEICEKPQDREIMPTHLILDVKRNGDGKPIERKARGCVGGNFQVPGVDFDKVSSPVLGKEVTLLLFIIAQKLNWIITACDIVGAFLSSDIDRDIYVRPFPMLWLIGINVNSKQCLRLKKGVYGTKQSALLFYNLCVKVLIGMNSKRCLSNPCLFYRDGAIVGLHVDDFHGIFENESTKNKFVNELEMKLKVKFAKFPDTMVGLKVTRRDDKSILLNMPGKIDRLVNEYELGKVKGQRVPLKVSPYDVDGELLVNYTVYQRLLGQTGFITSMCRPDMAAGQGMLSTYNHKPTNAHFKLGKQMITYLRDTKDLGIVIPWGDGKNEFIIDSYGDSSFMSSPYDSRSRSGVVVKVNDCTTMWGSNLQSFICDSSTGAEYYVLNEACKGMQYLNNVLEELNMNVIARNLYTDNQACYRLADDFSSNKRMRHIDRKFHMVRELVDQKYLKLNWLGTKQMPADILTKVFPEGKASEFESKRSTLVSS
eukprot:Pgem_evm1s12941